MRRSFFIFLILHMASYANAMDSIFFGGTSSNAGGTVFGSPVGNNTLSATESQRIAVIPYSGTLKNLYVTLVTAPGVGTSRTYTVRLNNSTDTAMVCTVSDTATTCNNVTDQPSVSAGDTVSVKQTVSGVPASSAGIYFTFLLSGTAQQSAMSAQSTVNMSTTTAVYSSPMGAEVAWDANYANTAGIVPTPGTIKNLYTSITAATGAGNTRTFMYYKNGSPTSLTCTISNPATTCNDTSNSFAVVAGDSIGIQQTTSGTQATTAAGRWATQFMPTTDGENVFSYANDVALNVAAAQQNVVTGSGSGATWAGEAGRRLITSSGTYKSFFVDLTTAPTTGKSYTFSFRKNAATQTLTAAVTDTNTTNNDTTHTFTTVPGDFVNLQNTGSGTPIGSQGRFGYVVFNTQPSTNVPRRTLTGVGQ